MLTKKGGPMLAGSRVIRAVVFWGTWGPLSDNTHAHVGCGLWGGKEPKWMLFITL